MTTVQEEIDTFKQLTLDEKKTIILDMIKDLKDVNENFKYIYETLPTLELNDQLMDDVYADLTNLAEEKKTAIKAIELNKVTKMSEYIKKLQEREAKERAEENVDDILKKI